MERTDVFEIIKVMLLKDPNLSIEVLPNGYSEDWPIHLKIDVGSANGLIEDWDTYQKNNNIEHKMYFNAEEFKNYRKFNINVVQGKTHKMYPDQVKQT